MRKDQCYKVRWTAIVAAAVLLTCSARAFAIESVTIPLEVEREDVVFLELPTIVEGETSVFDFILDPQELLYKTDAVRFGGGTVEEGATLLFQNSEGQYDFSRYSDQLTVTNQSTVPVRLTVSACISDLGELQVVGSDDFADSGDCSFYMAVVDSQGNVRPISADGEVSISLEMHADFDRYSFGLVGACNPNANWLNVSVHPVVTVTWRVEPLTAGQEAASAENRDTEDVILESTVSGSL